MNAGLGKKQDKKFRIRRHLWGLTYLELIFALIILALLVSIGTRFCVGSPACTEWAANVGTFIGWPPTSLQSLLEGISKLGPIATFLVALIAWRTYRQKVEADIHGHWWEKATWSIDLALKDDRQSRLAGLIAITEHSRDTRESRPGDAKLFISVLKVIQDEEMKDAEVATPADVSNPETHILAEQQAYEHEVKGSDTSNHGSEPNQKAQSHPVVDEANEKGDDGYERRHHGTF